MTIFYLEWNSFCNEDMIAALRELGHDVVRIPFRGYSMLEKEIAEMLDVRRKQYSCDFLFSFNYFPRVSDYCERNHLKYVSWVYDSPHIHVYSYTVLNPCNYIFLFDRALYEELRNGGIETVYYMPLAVNDKRLGALKNGDDKKYAGDVSFVGSLYSEQKHRLYDKFDKISEYTKGYLDGLIRSQLHVPEYHFLQEMLSPDIVAEMQRVYPTDPNAESALSPEGIYAEYVLARRVTAIERREIMELLGQKQMYSVNLYTYDRTISIPGVENKGALDYYDEMPYVFMNSKINLNITLRSIRTGIPLRAFDIMGSGGFLLTNYQEELFSYFEENKDFVCYTDYEELCEKTGYYLRHEEERLQIAANGCRKVRSQHNMRLRTKEMLDIVAGERT